jgi:hypothetical protein
MVAAAGSSPWFKSCTFSSSSQNGLKCTGSAACEIAFCSFLGNVNGLYNENPGHPSLTFLCFEFNSGYGVYSSNVTDILDASCCWWGSTDGPSGAGPGSGDAVSANVLFDLWNRHGCWEATGVDTPDVLEPRVLRLAGPAPNPSTGYFRCTASIPSNGQVHLELFDASGRKVRTLVDEVLPKGIYTFEMLQGHTILPNGIYFLQLRTSGNSLTRKMVIAH